MDPREVFEAINLAFDDDTQYTTGCGITQIWSGQYQRINKPRKYFPSGGAGTLGFDIPAAKVDEYMGPIIRAAVSGDFSLIKTMVA
jgi:tartronate-semialdehyde synthase